MSGCTAASHDVTIGKRARMLLTFQDAMRMAGSSRLSERIGKSIRLGISLDGSVRLPD